MSELYTVQKILNKKVTKNGGILYQVKWKGYPLEESTWEPKNNLKYVQELIDQFEKENIQVKQPIEQQPKVNHLSMSKVNLIYEEDHSNSSTQQAKVPEVAKQQPKSTQEGGIIFTLNEDELEEEEENLLQPEKKDYQPRRKVREFLPPKDRKLKKPQPKQPEQNFRQSSSNHPSKTFASSRVSKNYPSPEPSISQPLLNGNKATSQSDQFEQKRKGNSLKSKNGHPDLQQIQQNLRYHSKSMNKKGEVSVNPPQVKILQLRKDAEGNLEFMVEMDDLLCMMRNEYLIQHYPDELIRFYESKIEFYKIPKMPK